MATKPKKTHSKKKCQESECHETANSQLKDSCLNQKLDILLGVVKGLDVKIQEQDVRLQKQEDQDSIANVSSFLQHKVCTKKMESSPDQLPSLEDLKSISYIQAERDKRIQESNNLYQNKFSGKPNTVIKSGRLRYSVVRFKN